MRAREVVVTQPRSEREAATPRAGIGRHVGPVPNQCLDKPLRLPIGLWAVRPRPADAHARPLSGLAKRVTAIGTAIVGEDPPDVAPASGKPLQRPTKK